MKIDPAQAQRYASWWLCVIEGYNAYLGHRDLKDCPYTVVQERIAWAHGWRSAAFSRLADAMGQAREAPHASRD